MGLRSKFLSQKKQRGQSLVELGLTMMVMLWLLSGAVDFGLGFFAYVAIRDAAQEGALFGSINPPLDATSHGCDHRPRSPVFHDTGGSYRYLRRGGRCGCYRHATGFRLCRESPHGHGCLSLPGFDRTGHHGYRAFDHHPRRLDQRDPAACLPMIKMETE